MADFFDLHSHCMYGFDDGAAKRTETLEMLHLARQAGFGTVTSTPHVMIGVYEHDREVLEETIAGLKDEMATQVPGMVVVPGAEYYLDDNFYGLLEDGNLFPLGIGNHLLVELPLLKIPPMAKDWAFRIRIKGRIPVLAHPERYGDVGRKPELAEMLYDAGYLLQINLGSLIGMYGRKARKAAEWMLKNGLVDFAGSDAHTPKHATTIYSEGLAALRDIAGDAGLQRLLVDNPREALGYATEAKEGI